MLIALIILLFIVFGGLALLELFFEFIGACITGTLAFFGVLALLLNLIF